MLEKKEEKQELIFEPIVEVELEIEELEQRLEMSCTRCCIQAEL